jgi:hypothetical protein
MRTEDRLDEASNWSPCKTKITFFLEELELWDIVQAPVMIPPAPAPSSSLDADFRKDNIKATRTFCDVVRDHIIPHLIGKDYTFEMWASLCKLFQSPNQNRRMVLHEKLKSIQMLDFETVTSYLGRFTQIRDELAVAGEIVDPYFLARTTLNNFSKPWGSFVRGIVAREVMPTWERLWDDFVQEELRCSFGSSGQQHTPGGDEDLALWLKSKTKIGEGARQGSKGGTQPTKSGNGQKDIRKVRCFACGEMGHYAGQCPKRKKKREHGGMATTTEEEEFDA